MKFTGKCLFIVTLLALSPFNVFAQEFAGDASRQREEMDAKKLARLGYQCFKDGDYANAVRYWHDAIAQDRSLAAKLKSGLAKAYSNCGEAHYRKGEYCAAGSDFKEALQLDRDSAKIREALARADKACKNPLKAAPAPFTAAAQNPNTVSGAPPAGRAPPQTASPQNPRPGNSIDALRKVIIIRLLIYIFIMWGIFASRWYKNLSSGWRTTFIIVVAIGSWVWRDFIIPVGIIVLLKTLWDKYCDKDRILIRPADKQITPAPPPPPDLRAEIKAQSRNLPAPAVPAAAEPSRPSLGKVGALMEQGKYKKALEAFLVKDPRQISEADKVNLFEIHVHLENFDRAGGLFEQIKGGKPLKENISRYKSLAALCYEKRQTGLARKVCRGLFGALKETRNAGDNNAGLYYGFARSCEDNGDIELARDICRHLIEAGLGGYKDAAVLYEDLKARAIAAAPAAVKNIPAQQAARPGVPVFGQVLDGRYELRRGIGEGGMGVVYEGWDRQLCRKVAVKRLHSWLKDSPEEYGRFKYEAKIVGRLKHPNIVGVHSVIEEDGEIYLIFDYVDGKTLSGILKTKKRFPIEECRDIFSGVCAAVHYAHKSNVIHRDLKPANIMLDMNGYAFVMDFGLASELRESLSRVTHQTTSGTPAYMAPEQHEGIVKRESDIYAMGVCLYEMLTGALPFRGPDALKLKLAKDYREVSAMLPWLPGGVDDLLSRALEPAPSQRIDDALDFLDGLKKL